LKLSINNKQFRTKRGKYCSNNKLAEQSAKISKLEHKATEQGWTTKNNMKMGVTVEGAGWELVDTISSLLLFWLMEASIR
jgi:hypothetical protein